MDLQVLWLDLPEKGAGRRVTTSVLKGTKAQGPCGTGLWASSACCIYMQGLQTHLQRLEK